MLNLMAEYYSVIYEMLNFRKPFGKDDTDDTDDSIIIRVMIINMEDAE